MQDILNIFYTNKCIVLHLITALSSFLTGTNQMLDSSFSSVSDKLCMPIEASIFLWKPNLQYFKSWGLQRILNEAEVFELLNPEDHFSVLITSVAI